MDQLVIRKLALSMVLGVLALPAGRAQAQLAGDWQGTLRVNTAGVEWRLALQLSADKAGALTGTLRIIDSDGAPATPVTGISLKGSTFRIAVDAMHASYESTVNKAGSEIDGTWSWLGQSQPLNFRRAIPQAALKPVPPSDIDGIWAGVLHADDVQVRTFLKIVNTSAGLTAEWQTPDQSPTWVFATGVRRDGAALTIEVKAIGATFAGRISEDRDSIDGAFTQAGRPLPLNLTRVKKLSEP